MLGTSLFGGDDGTTPLVGLNWSNSVDCDTLEIAAETRTAASGPNAHPGKER